MIRYLPDKRNPRAAFSPTPFFFEDMVVLNEKQKDKYSQIMGDGVFRLSVGIEDPDDIIQDLPQVLGSGT